MPLMHKESKKAFQHNVKEEMDAHPGHRAQDLAIAYAIQKKARKEHEAQGGEMHMCSGGRCEHPSHKMAGGGDSAMEHEEHMSKRDRAMAAFHGKKMAEGGMMTHEGYQSKDEPEVDGGDAHPMEEEHVSHPEAHDSHVEHEEFNEDGAQDEGAGGGNEIHPMVMKIMMGRAKGYSKGGVVANEDSGESSEEPEDMAKWQSNELDDLAKDDHLEGHYKGSKEHGDEQEDEDRHDIVKRVMKSRSKRDRMAVPGEGSSYGKGR